MQKPHAHISRKRTGSPQGIHLHPVNLSPLTLYGQKVRGRINRGYWLLARQRGRNRKRWPLYKRWFNKIGDAIGHDKCSAILTEILLDLPFFLASPFIIWYAFKTHAIVGLLTTAALTWLTLPLDPTKDKDEIERATFQHDLPEIRKEIKQLKTDLRCAKIALDRDPLGSFSLKKIHKLNHTLGHKITTERLRNLFTLRQTIRQNTQALKYAENQFGHLLAPRNSHTLKDRYFGATYQTIAPHRSVMLLITAMLSTIFTSIVYIGIKIPEIRSARTIQANDTLNIEQMQTRLIHRQTIPHALLHKHTIWVHANPRVSINTLGEYMTNWRIGIDGRPWIRKHKSTKLLHIEEPYEFFDEKLQPKPRHVWVPSTPGISINTLGIYTVDWKIGKDGKPWIRKWLRPKTHDYQDRRPEFADDNLDITYNSTATTKPAEIGY